MTSNPSSASPLETLDLNSQYKERYTVGADLGQSQDPTAVAVVRRLDRWPAKPIFQVGHLGRLPLGTSYPNVVSHVTNMLHRPPLLGKAELVIDFTGVGRPVFDMFVGRGVSPIGVTITAGESYYARRTNLARSKDNPHFAHSSFAPRRSLENSQRPPGRRRAGKRATRLPRRRYGLWLLEVRRTGRQA